MKMKLDEQIRSGVELGGEGDDGLEDNVLEALRNEMAND